MREYNTDPNLYNDEFWRPFPDEPFTFYYGSNYGRVKNSRTGRILKPGLDTKGYEYVILNNNNIKKNIKVHRFVLRCFNDIPNYDEMTINHIDAVHDNNKLENLEWCTFEENMELAYNKGLLSLRGKRKNPIIERTKRQKENFRIHTGIEIADILKKFSELYDKTTEDIINDAISEYIARNKDKLPSSLIL